jgi:hypothetical protein
MRMPDISLMVLNKPHSTEQDSRSAMMFSLLDPSKFTLLYSNVAIPRGVEANLAPWRDLIESYQISPLDASVEHKHFTDKLGNSLRSSWCDQIRILALLAMKTLSRNLPNTWPSG